MLLVKDFDAHGFTTSDEFMTNADVPALATEDLIDAPVNPFTGNAITSEDKTQAASGYVILSDEWQIAENNGYQFLPAAWAHVSGNVNDKENWTFLEGRSTLPADFVG